MTTVLLDTHTWCSGGPQSRSRLSTTATRIVEGAERAGDRIDHLVRAGVVGAERTDHCGDPGAVLVGATRSGGPHRRHHPGHRRHRGEPAGRVSRRSRRPAHVRDGDRARLAARHEGPPPARASPSPHHRRLVRRDLRPAHRRLRPRPVAPGGRRRAQRPAGWCRGRRGRRPGRRCRPGTAPTRSSGGGSAWRRRHGWATTRRAGSGTPATRSGPPRGAGRRASRSCWAASTTAGQRQPWTAGASGVGGAQADSAGARVRTAARRRRQELGHGHDAVMPGPVTGGLTAGLTPGSPGLFCWALAGGQPADCHRPSRLPSGSLK